MEWEVLITPKAKKEADKLPKGIWQRFAGLLARLRVEGPIQPRCSHFGKLKGQGDVYHCHLKDGRPTYVAVWEVVDGGIRLIEVTYVGTHEKAPY